MSMMFFLLHQNYCWSQSAPLFSVGNDCEVDKWVCQFVLPNYVKYVTVLSPLTLTKETTLTLSEEGYYQGSRHVFPPESALPHFDTVGEPYLQAYFMLTSNKEIRSNDACQRGSPTVSLFWRVNLPVARTSIIAGLLLGWLRALGEFGATVVMAYHPYTLPVYLYVQLSGTGVSAALPLALLMLGVSLIGVGLALFLQSANRRRKTRQDERATPYAS